jgi:cytoskeletal protein RodZ
MPKLNLKDDGFEEEQNPLDTDDSMAPPPTLREVGGGGEGGGKSSVLLIVLLVVGVLALGVFALNYFKVIHLWGKKVPKSTAQIDNTLPLPEPQMNQGTATQQPDQTQPGAENAATTPTPTTTTPAGTPEPNLESTPAASTPAAVQPLTTSSTPAPKFVPPASSGSGSFTVQVSSWTSKALAEKQAGRLTEAGMSAFVEDVVIAGENWYRVRVGHYATSKEAKDAADQLSRSLEGRIWVARMK